MSTAYALQPKPERVISLDVFRGLTMALMVLVSHPGSLDIYTQLDHAAWNGWTITDVVFPSFLWIIGVSITLSVGKRLAKGTPRRSIVLHALWRSAVLYAIGVFIYAIGSFDPHTFRFLGVLQRIAICYILSVLLSLWVGVRRQILCIAGPLLCYWLLMRFVPVPGFGAGNWSVEGNLAHYVDHIVLGSHNYVGTGTWDPEGIVSTLPALATTLFGVLGGALLKRRESIRERCVWMLLIGSVLLASGLVCSHWMPINKKLWTDSFCLFMAGMDFVLFGILLWLVDGCKFRRGLTLPLAFGQNALTVYVLSEVASAVLWSYPRSSPWHQRLFAAVYAGVGPPKMSSLLYALTVLAVMTAIAWYMRRRGWIVKL